MYKKEIRMLKKLILPIILTSLSSSIVFAAPTIVEKNQYNKDEITALAFHKKPISILKASREPIGSVVKINAKVDYNIDEKTYVLRDYSGVIYSQIDPNVYTYGTLYRGVHVQLTGVVNSKDKNVPPMIDVSSIKVLR